MVEDDETFVGVRDDVEATLPLSRHRFVAAETAVAVFRTAPGIEYDQFNADLDDAASQDPMPCGVNDRMESGGTR